MNNIGMSYDWNILLDGLAYFTHLIVVGEISGLIVDSLAY